MYPLGKGEYPGGDFFFGGIFLVDFFGVVSRFLGFGLVGISFGIYWIRGSSWSTKKRWLRDFFGFLFGIRETVFVWEPQVLAGDF